MAAQEKSIISKTKTEAEKLKEEYEKLMQGKEQTEQEVAALQKEAELAKLKKQQAQFATAALFDRATAWDKEERERKAKENERSWETTLKGLAVKNKLMQNKLDEGFEDLGEQIGDPNLISGAVEPVKRYKMAVLQHQGADSYAQAYENSNLAKYSLQAKASPIKLIPRRGSYATEY